MEQFSLRGIHSTTMANIVEASALSAGAIYTHFTGKHEIIAYVAESTFGAIFSGVEEIARTFPIPEPPEMLRLISRSIADAKIPSGMIVQIWGEAATNHSVREATNVVYARAISVLEEYCERWLQSDASRSDEANTAGSASLAHLLVSMIYAQILQMTLIEGYEPGALADDFGAILQA